MNYFQFLLFSFDLIENLRKYEISKALNRIFSKFLEQKIINQILILSPIKDV